MKVSIVIAGVSGKTAVSNCIASIQRCAHNLDFDLVVIHGAPDEIFQIRMQGMKQATGDRIAVIGDRYEASPSWFRALFEERLFDLTGGCVAPSPNLNYWGWCVYLSEYAHVAPPLVDGVTTDPKSFMGGNVVYSSFLVGRVKPAPDDTDLSFNERLLQENVSAGILGALELFYACPPSFLEYIRERFEFSRAIARRRRGMWKLLVVPFLPLIVIWRTAASVIRKRRYRLRFLLCSPVIVCLAFAQAVGECIGVLESLFIGQNRKIQS